MEHCDQKVEFKQKIAAANVTREADRFARTFSVLFFASQSGELGYVQIDTLCVCVFFNFSFQLLADYEEQFKESNPKAFLEQWPIYELKLREICNQKYECVKHTAWPDEIENILLLLKLFPSKTGNVESFYKSIEKLIVFCVVSIPAMK